MAVSPYLTQALQQMASAQATPPTYMGPEQMAGIAKQAQAYQASDPGGSLLGHNLMQAGRNLFAAPGNAASGLAALAQLLGVTQDPAAGLY